MSLQLLQQYLGRVIWTSGGGSTLTLGNALLAIGLVAGGGLASHFLAHFLAKRLPLRMVPSHHARELVPRAIFLTLWALFFLAALRIFGIPLTLFNFLGGAIALGFGFGAQNLCSNLISGAIILVSRPYKVGDIVEVDQQTGTVLAIGLRATEVRTYDGVDLLVPNSHFLANVIVNRTNYERSLRGLVAISAAYGSDTRLVDETLRAVAAAHLAVLTAPGKAPWVLFDHFGASGLEFKLYFWVDTTRQGVAATASDIRHAALAAFRERGIAIPYPQLDVHLPQTP